MELTNEHTDAQKRAIIVALAVINRRTLEELNEMTKIPAHELKELVSQLYNRGDVNWIKGNRPDSALISLTSQGEKLWAKELFEARMRQHYISAFNAQSACNFGALVLYLAEAMPDIRADSNARGIPHEKHPIIRLFVEQMAHLATGGPIISTSAHDSYSAAYDECLIGIGELPEYMAQYQQHVDKLLAQKQAQKADGEA